MRWEKMVDFNWSYLYWTRHEMGRTVIYYVCLYWCPCLNVCCIIRGYCLAWEQLILDRIQQCELRRFFWIFLKCEFKTLS